MRHEEKIDLLAKTLSDILEHIYGKEMGFALFMFEFGEDKKAGDYVSNGPREDMIKFMREVADRIEKNEYIPRPIGEA